MAVVTSQCSTIDLFIDSSNKPYTHLNNNEWSSYTIDPIIESINIDELPIKSINHEITLSNSINNCSIETQLYNEEEKLLTQSLINNNQNNNTTNNSKVFNDSYYDRDLLHNSYFYNNNYYYDLDYDLMDPTITPTFNHSSIINRDYTRNTRKIDNDPTILLSLLKWSRIGSNQLNGDDDQIDRINYQFTSVLLLILLTLTGFRQYLSHLPLQCWIPQEFSRSWEEYAEHYCWVTNTYFANVQSTLPPVNNRTTIIRYYQWATFVFILQAAGFFLPCLIWRLLQNHSGFHVQRIMRSAIRLNCTETDSSQLITYGLARYIDNVIYHKSYKQWRIHSPKIKSQFKQKTSKNHSRMKSTPKSTSHTSSSTTTTLTSASHEIVTETKLVKFENESLTIETSSPNPCRTLSNECTVIRSYKKYRAPQPPVTTTTNTTTTTTTTSTTTVTTTTTIVITTNTTTPTTDAVVTTKNPSKINSDQIIYTSSPILKSTSNVTQSKLNSLPNRNQHKNLFSPICNPCELCFTNISIMDKKNVKSKSSQPLVTTGKIRETPPTPTATPPPPTTTTTTTATSELTTGEILFNPKNNSKLQVTQSSSSSNLSMNLFQQNSSYWSCYPNHHNEQHSLHHHKSPYQTIYIQTVCYQLIYNLWLLIRCLFTLLCLLPTCLCHWLLCGNQKIKRFKYYNYNYSFLFYLYIIIKLLYLINIIGQLYLMKLFLGVKSYFFGYYVIKDLINGHIWNETGHFPRVTYCDFETKKLGKNYKYTLQCVLPLNLFLEKVYVFLWFWFIFIGILTSYSLFKWLLRLTINHNRIQFINKFLYTIQTTEFNPILLKYFINHYLHLDGLFLLWLISINISDLIIHDLIIKLWNLFNIRLITLKSSIYDNNTTYNPNISSSSSSSSNSNDRIIHPLNQNIKFSYTINDPMIINESNVNPMKSSILLKLSKNEQKNYHSLISSIDSIKVTKYNTYNDYHNSMIYSKPFIQSYYPGTKYGDIIHGTTTNNTTHNVTPTTNNNDITTICHSTDLFESSDSIV
ncbi:unnamed protein product [Schistosoma rodhaini]|uniref:Innexin n=1 Tax=Schistosoma rodhaini TaxID=6188 RepID=A0AA85FLN0_9TREM|nr:unnamed protein product [Schistosoma rodhaini]CAH8537383.1 unnamed protein product [Schistosoma rodhaini]